MANAELNPELIEKVKAAKSPEELLALARENGIANFTGTDAQACFRQKPQTGELSDDELEQAAGGRSGGQKIINPLHSCSKWAGCDLGPKVCCTCSNYAFVQPDYICTVG